MNGLNGKPTEYPENALVPYPVILAASKGDQDAMKIVLQHFSGYIDVYKRQTSISSNPRIWSSSNRGTSFISVV